MTPPFIATYSIIGCDLDAREWGIAVQSKFLAVGAAVPYARAEVGAVATQALANLAYGPDGLELLASGLAAQEVVKRLIEADPQRDHRQLGVVDAAGDGATYTGSSCLDWAGGLAGRGFAAQGNILASRATVEALASTFERSAGTPLAPRLLQCLEAAQSAGGDRRGQQSAALIVVREHGGYGGANDRVVDLRVDDDSTPIAELARLLELHQLYFGATPPEKWVDVTPALRAEIEERLRQLGYTQPELLHAFEAWAGTENLEERVNGIDRIDPVVLTALRATG
jgi:uncharacterized Ntn-hydrolase superfamily protein